MAKRLETTVFIIIAVCSACVLASEVTEGAHADHFSPDLLERISDNYIQRTERAQHLRKELHDQLNLLSHLNTMTDHAASNDKFMFFALLGHVRRTFQELDEILDGFVPSVADAHEVVHNFKLVSQGAEDDEAHNAESSQEQPRQARAKKDFDWFKRNYNPYGSNLYSKVPVIRTGK
jgi:hypothetical protein